MATFELKSQLPRETRNELDRIEAIPSGLRNASDAAFLVALAPYRTNRVIRYSTSGTDIPDFDAYAADTETILEAEGNTIPHGYEGFEKGAIFYDLDRTGMNVFINVGDETFAIWVMATSELYSPSVSPSVSVSLSPSASISASPSLSPSVSISLSPSVSAPCGTTSLSVEDTPGYIHKFLSPPHPKTDAYLPCSLPDVCEMQSFLSFLDNRADLMCI